MVRHRGKQIPEVSVRGKTLPIRVKHGTIKALLNCVFSTEAMSPGERISFEGDIHKVAILNDITKSCKEKGVTSFL